MFEDKDPTNFDMYGERWGRSEKSLSRRQALLGGASAMAGLIVAGVVFAAGDGAGGGGGGDQRGGADDSTATSSTSTNGSAGQTAPAYPLSRPSSDSFLAFMAYDPSTDPDAVYFRSVVPLAAQIDPLAATQAHPALDPRPGAATLAAPYRTIQRGFSNDLYRRTRHAAMPTQGVQVPRRLGVHDIVVQWAGTGIIPNPATTDAAHRNGTICLGTIFQPDRRAFDGSVFPVEAVAKQYVRLAQYFGFDGYFVNHEQGSAVDDTGVANLMAAMRTAAAQAGLARFHVQHYNGQTDLLRLFPRAGGVDPAPNSAMPDQGWSGYSGPGNCCAGLQTSPALNSAAIGVYQRTKFDIFYGFQLYPGPGYIGVAGPDLISPSAADKVEGSLQLYSLDDGILNLSRARQSGRGAAFLPANADLPTIERMIYSGQTENPALLNSPNEEQQAAYGKGRRYTEWATTNDDYSKSDNDQADLPITYGVANFITERSAIGAMPFVTHFNEGEGQSFFVGGEPVSNTAWFNLGVQDLLPTWQWWRAPFAGLTDRNANAAGLLDAGFDRSVAYDGGTSLRVSGTLGPSTETRLHLYKTDLPIAGGSAMPTLELIARGAAVDRLRTRVGLIFVDQPTQVRWLPLVSPNAVSGTASDWVPHRLDLREFAGRRIAAILLGFQAVDGATQAIDIRCGRLALTDRTSSAPTAPTGLRLDRRVVDPDTGAIGLALRWNESGRYDVFQRSSGDGQRIWIGRIDGDAFYSPTALPSGTGAAIIEVQAIGPGGAGGITSISV